LTAATANEPDLTSAENHHSHSNLTALGVVTVNADLKRPAAGGYHSKGKVLREGVRLIWLRSTPRSRVALLTRTPAG
jgi:hypothetical protein